jgi:nitroreductase
MEELKARLVEKTIKKEEIDPDVPVPELTDLHLQRQQDLMERMDNHLFAPGTDMLDKKRAEYLLKGTRFHDAPNGIIMYMEKVLCPNAIFDAGIMAQTISLAAPAYGLGTCIMGRVVYWPDILRDLLGIPENKTIIMGIAVGYPDPEALENRVERIREPLKTFAHWHGV